MNIDKFKHQHTEILSCISRLRTLSRSGVSKNAEAISALIVSMSSIIRLHLAVEDKTLYPAIRHVADASLAAMGKRFQDAMGPIASTYLAFARRWNTPASLSGNPEGFRSDANVVLKTLYERMCKEDAEFYPAIEAC